MPVRPIKPAALVLGLAVALGACHNTNSPDEETAELRAAPVHAEAAAELILRPQPIPLQPHPWVGKTIRIRDWGGDAYDRCLGPGGPLVSGAQLQAELCYPTPYDSLQRFVVIHAGTTSFPDFDPKAVVLRSAYNSALCLDVRGGTANGTEAIQLYPCHYGSNQKFHLPLPATSGASSGYILSKVSGYNMAVEADAPVAPNGPVVRPVWHRPFNTARVFQTWRFQEWKGYWATI